MNQRQKKLLIERAWDIRAKQLEDRIAALNKKLEDEQNKQAERITARLQKELAAGRGTVVVRCRSLRHSFGRPESWTVTWSDATRKYLANIHAKLSRQERSNERWRYDYQNRTKKMMEEFEFDLEFSDGTAEQARELLDAFTKKLEALK